MMKTPKQLSDEVLRKISAQKEKLKHRQRNLQRMAAVIAIIAVVVPVSLHFSNNFALKDLAPSGGNMAGNMENFPNHNNGESNGSIIIGSDNETDNRVPENAPDLEYPEDDIFEETSQEFFEPENSLESEECSDDSLESETPSQENTSS